MLGGFLLLLWLLSTLLKSAVRRDKSKHLGD